MFQNIAPGTYYPGDSLLHRLRARTKLLALFWLVVFLAVANQRRWHFAPYLAALALLCAGVGLSGIGAGTVWRRLRLLVLLSLIGAAATLPFEVGTPLYALGPLLVSFGALRWLLLAGAVVLAALVFARPRRWRAIALLPLALCAALLWLIRDVPPGDTFPLGPLVLTDDGVWLLVSVFAVFLLLYALAMLLTMTTTPVGLIEGLTLLLAPLRLLRLPVDEFALMTLIALRFVPTLIDETEQLIKAQTARGADFTGGRLVERAQSLATLFVPLLHGVWRRAAELATALDARGYTVEGRPTALHEAALGPADYLALGAVVLVTLASLAL